MNGSVTGGWSFVWAAYSITAFILGFYVVKTLVVLRTRLRVR
jgi:heme exporter protein D